MQQEDLLRWIDTQSTRKRPREQSPSGSERKRTRVEHMLCGIRNGQDHLSGQNVRGRSSTSALEVKKTRSEGDLLFYNPKTRLETQPLSPVSPNETEEPNEMNDIVPPSPTGSRLGQMPPPLRPPSSRTSSRGRSNSSGSTKKADITSSSYRSQVLRPNHVYIGYYDTPEDVYEAAKGILGNEVPSTQPVNEGARIAKLACDLVNEGEQSITDALGPELLIQAHRIGPHAKLRRNNKMPFDADAVPRSFPPEGLPSLWPAISLPIPDMLYGYAADAFTGQQDMARLLVDEKTGRQLSNTSKDLYWGFFVVEFKSQATGGTIWAATNQCAGGGSTCTNASDQLFRLAATTAEDYHRTDSISFSLAIDGKMASLYVHWREESKGFYLHELDAYILTKATDVVRLKQHAENIVRWGMGARLEATKVALDKILADELQRVQAAKNSDLGNNSAMPDCSDG